MNHQPRATLATLDRPARLLLGAAVLGFIALDIQLWSGTVERVVRLVLLALAFLPAVYIAYRQPQVLRALWRPPLVFFSVFVGLLFAATPAAISPVSSLRYAVGYLGVEVIVAAVAFVFTPRMALRGLLGALMFKVVGSLPLLALTSSWFLGDRFQGLVGNPNPMGAVAGLAFLLVVLVGWYEWPRTGSRLVLVGLGLASTIILAESRSYSALAATMIPLIALAWHGTRRAGTRQSRRSSVVIALALLIPVAMVILDGPQRSSSAALGLSRRAELRAYWTDAIAKRPWLGYGAGSTPLLAPPDAPGYAKSAHNLYLEASMYAGVPAGVVMWLFMAWTCAAALWRAYRRGARGDAGLAAVIVFYAALSVGVPVILNGAPSSLVPPLVVAALCSLAAGQHRRCPGQDIGDTDVRWR